MESAMCVVDRAYIKTVRTTMVMLIGDVLLVCRLRGPLRELRTLFEVGAQNNLQEEVHGPAEQHGVDAYVRHWT